MGPVGNLKFWALGVLQTGPSGNTGRVPWTRCVQWRVPIQKPWDKQQKLMVFHWTGSEYCITQWPPRLSHLCVRDSPWLVLSGSQHFHLWLNYSTVWSGVSHHKMLSLNLDTSTICKNRVGIIHNVLIWKAGLYLCLGGVGSPCLFDLGITHSLEV